jgi:nucleoside-triphosphatase THEP1
MVQAKLILWTGKRHCGKTTSVFKLAESVRSEGFTVAGLLAPAVYEGERLVGFDLVDLKRGRRIALASRRVKTSDLGCVSFTDEGIRFGKEGLALESARTAELVIVDEFGPLELAGRGWRKEVDLLLASVEAVVVLVVRDELVEQVRDIYKNYPMLILAATGQSTGRLSAESIDNVISILRQRSLVRQKSD